MLITGAPDGSELTEPQGVGISLNFGMFDRFAGDIDVFASHARENAGSVTGPINQPWNVREVTMFDPDGYKLVFTVPFNTNLGSDQMLEQARGDKITK